MFEYTTPGGVIVDENESLADFITQRVAKNPSEVVVEYKLDEDWKSISALEFQEQVLALSAGLANLGVKKGTGVAIVAATSYNWMLLDFAVLRLGGVSVPIYETSSEQQIAHILSDADIEFVFAGTQEIYDRISQIQHELNGLFRLDTKTLDCIAASPVDVETFSVLSRQVKASDLATIVYTSGSTGLPKGVELTHRNFVAIVRAGLTGMPELLMRENARLLLFLPLAHVFARFLEFQAIAGTTCVGLVPSVKTLLPDLAHFKPTYVLGVPRVFEKVLNASSQKAGTGLAGKLFSAAVKSAVANSKAQQADHTTKTTHLKPNPLFNALIYSKIKDVLGGQVEYMVSGGAPIDPDLAHFFNGLGLPVLEGYGLTETAAPAFVNRPHFNTVGTVGQPLPGVSVRIDQETSEVLIKGDGVTKGYHNLPELNENLFKDGFLRSGDLGSLNETGHLQITGRLKDIIVTAGGKNVSPGALEEIIKTLPIVANCILIGDSKPFISALITLDTDNLPFFLKSNGQDENIAVAQAKKLPVVLAAIDQVVAKANLTVSRAESIRKYYILDEDFTEENGQLSPALKVRRPEVLKLNAELIDREIYGV
ncbi:AMP-binding protein [Actinomycetota bacterium]|nr:AMP-binding protein [Actinomycetota bacterium]